MVLSHDKPLTLKGQRCSINKVVSILFEQGPFILITSNASVPVPSNFFLELSYQNSEKYSRHDYKFCHQLSKMIQGIIENFKKNSSKSQ